MQSNIYNEPPKKIVSVHNYLVKFGLKQRNILQTLHTTSYFRQEVNDVKSTVDPVDFHRNIQCTAFKSERDTCTVQFSRQVMKQISISTYELEYMMYATRVLFLFDYF